MDWTTAGGRIEPGQSLRWWIYWRNNPGTQIIEARPVPETEDGITVTAPAELRTSDQTLKMELEGYTYQFTVTHVSGWSTNYVIVGKRIG
jgi:hypothetical protein